MSSLVIPKEEKSQPVRNVSMVAATQEYSQIKIELVYPQPPAIKSQKKRRKLRVKPKNLLTGNISNCISVLAKSSVSPSQVPTTKKRLLRNRTLSDRKKPEADVKEEIFLRTFSEQLHERLTNNKVQEISKSQEIISQQNSVQKQGPTLPPGSKLVDKNDAKQEPHQRSNSMEEKIVPRKRSKKETKKEHQNIETNEKPSNEPNNQIHIDLGAPCKRNEGYLQGSNLQDMNNNDIKPCQNESIDTKETHNSPNSPSKNFEVMNPPKTSNNECHSNFTDYRNNGSTAEEYKSKNCSNAQQSKKNSANEEREHDKIKSSSHQWVKSTSISGCAEGSGTCKASYFRKHAENTIQNTSDNLLSEISENNVKLEAISCEEILKPQEETQFLVKPPLGKPPAARKQIGIRRNSLSLYKAGYQPGASINETLHSKATTQSRPKRNTGFHLSLNESTISFTGNSSNTFLEMSSGLLVNQEPRKYQFHLSLDASSTDVAGSVFYIKSKIFNENNEWNIEQTTPGRYLKTDRSNPNLIYGEDVSLESTENYLDDSIAIDSNCNFMSNQTQVTPQEMIIPSTRLSFLYNEKTGIICKNCFSSCCHHMEELTHADSKTENQCATSTNSPDKAKSEREKQTSFSKEVPKELIDEESINPSEPKLKEDRQEFKGKLSPKPVQQIHSNTFSEELNQKLKQFTDVAAQMRVVKMSEVVHKDINGFVVPFNEIEVEISSDNVLPNTLRSVKVTNNSDDNNSYGVDHLPESLSKDSQNEFIYNSTANITSQNVSRRISQISCDSNNVLYYDSDYDDASYLNGCITKPQTSSGKNEPPITLLDNERSTMITPPLIASSPTENVQKFLTENFEPLSTDNIEKGFPKRRTSLPLFVSLHTVFENDEHGKELLQNSTQSDGGVTFSESPSDNKEYSHAKCSLHNSPRSTDGRASSDLPSDKKDFSNGERSLHNSQRSNGGGTCSDVPPVNKEYSHSTIMSNESQEKNIVKPLTQAIQNKTTKFPFKPIRHDSDSSTASKQSKKCQSDDESDNISTKVVNQIANYDQESRITDLKNTKYSNLTIREMKKIARQQLRVKQALDNGLPLESVDLNETNSIDLFGNEIDSEDELQWFLQESRIETLKTENFSSDGSEVLPEDDEVRRINLPEIYCDEAMPSHPVNDDKVVLRSSSNNESILTYQDKSTNTESGFLDTVEISDFQLNDFQNNSGSYKHIDVLILDDIQSQQDSLNISNDEESLITPRSTQDSGVESNASLTHRSTQSNAQDLLIMVNNFQVNDNSYCEHSNAVVCNEPSSNIKSTQNHDFPFDKNSCYKFRNLDDNSGSTLELRKFLFSSDGSTSEKPLADELNQINRERNLNPPLAHYKQNLSYLLNEVPLCRDRSTTASILVSGRQREREDYFLTYPVVCKSTKTLHKRNLEEVLEKRTKIANTRRAFSSYERKQKFNVNCRAKELEQKLIIPKAFVNNSLPKLKDLTGLIVQGREVFRHGDRRKTLISNLNKTLGKENVGPVLTLPYKSINRRQVHV